MPNPFSLSLWSAELRARWCVPPARARLEVYPAERVLHEQGSGPGVLVFPGGGYGMTSLDEGCRVARRLAQAGISAGVCLYRVAPATYPAPLLDGCRAVRMFRSIARDGGFDPSNVTLLGFSAGGHLAGLVATQSTASDPAEDEHCGRPHVPEGLALIYPLVSLLGVTHRPSVERLLGSSPDEELRVSLSVERRVTRALPPLFVVHASDDVVVPVAQSLDLVARCVNLGLRPELHVLDRGGHGFAYEAPSESGFDWLGRFVVWLHKRKVNKEQ